MEERRRKNFTRAVCLDHRKDGAMAELLTRLRRLKGTFQLVQTSTKLKVVWRINGSQARHREMEGFVSKTLSPVGDQIIR